MWPRAALMRGVRHQLRAMAYYLHIDRSDEIPIALSEWQAAVASTDGVRIFKAAANAGINPKTGEVLSIRAGDGDVEVYFPDSGEWVAVFRWYGASAVFSPRGDVIDPTHPTWKAAVLLATTLGARIRGDDGEIYDFTTGRADA